LTLKDMMYHLCRTSVMGSCWHRTHGPTQQQHPATSAHARQADAAHSCYRKHEENPNVIH
jgi:hypothetical protein